MTTLVIPTQPCSRCHEPQPLASFALAPDGFTRADVCGACALLGSRSRTRDRHGKPAEPAPAVPVLPGARAGRIEISAAHAAIMLASGWSMVRRINGRAA